MLKQFALGSSAGVLGMIGFNSKAFDGELAQDNSLSGYATGVKPIKIKSVKAIATAPQGPNLVVVKVETTEPGLYGLGCATYSQRAALWATAVNNYLHDFAVEKDVDNIEDIWQAA